jgi:hypothetical protein
LQGFDTRPVCAEHGLGFFELQFIYVDKDQVAPICERAGAGETHSSRAAGNHQDVGIGHVRASQRWLRSLRRSVVAVTPSTGG